MMHGMIRLAPIVLISIVSQPLLAAERDAKSLIQEAAATYSDALETSDRNHRVQKFRTAESLFARVVESQATSGDGCNAELFVNLGNAALGAEHVGPAIVAYRRALTADPNHSRAKQNLEHARTLVADWLPKPEDDVTFGSFFDWTGKLKAADWRGLASIAFLLAAVCIAIFLWSGSKVSRNLGAVFALLWLALVLTAIFHSGDTTKIAVVIVSETTARSADSINSPARFPEPLPSGTEVEIVEDRDDWQRVRLFDGREVWLSRSALGFV